MLHTVFQKMLNHPFFQGVLRSISIRQAKQKEKKKSQSFALVIFFSKTISNHDVLVKSIPNRPISPLDILHRYFSLEYL